MKRFLLSLIILISNSMEAQSGSDSAKSGVFRRHTIYAELPICKAYQAFGSHKTGIPGLLKGYGIGYGYQLKGGGEIFAGLNAYFVTDRFGYIPRLVDYWFIKPEENWVYRPGTQKTGPNFLFTVQKRFYIFKKYRLQPFVAPGIAQYFTYAGEAVEYFDNGNTVEKINAWSGFGGLHFSFGLRYQHKQFGVSFWGSITRFYKTLTWTTTNKYKGVDHNTFIVSPSYFSISYSF